MKVCVFCSSSENLAHEYYETGFAVGKLLAKHGHSLVFGGYSKGIMGAVARGVQENGGKVVSVIPEVFNKVRPNFEDNAEVILADTMSSRKDKMIAMSDAFIALPGGIGTFDELFQVFAMKAVGETAKPLVILMQGESQRLLGRLLAKAQEESFISIEVANMVKFCESPEEIFDLLD